MYILYRDRDGAGERGHVRSYDPLTNTYSDEVPKVGHSVYIESPSRWWATTPVTEILESSDSVTRFKTENSTYTLEKRG